VTGKENDVTPEVQVRKGRCATHGPVEATREVPKPGFPYAVWLVRMVLAKRQPFRCPQCGAAVETG
jgi:hypothetical protein